MNERIKELRIQALRWSGENVNRTLYSDYEIQLKEYKKFAELIVRECADIAGEEDFDVMMKEGYPCSQTAKKIKEHFGVEE